jgi:hypothetical protein
LDGSAGKNRGTDPTPVRTMRNWATRARTDHPSGWDHRSGWNDASRWQRLVTSNLVLGLIVAVLAWPTSTHHLIVASGVGSSWRAAVTMAAHDHLAFGSRAVFTFGPLGFLVSPQLFFTSDAILAFIFELGFLTAIFGALIWSLRRTLPLSLAAAVAYLVGGISIVCARYFGTNVAVEDVLALVLMVCVSVLSRDVDDPPPLWIWVVLGGALSVFSLVKVSLAIGIVVAIVITVLCLPTHRRAALGGLVLGAVPLFCLGWFWTGNSLGNVLPYVRSSLAVIGGYGSAMALEAPDRGYSYWLAALAVILIGVFAIAHARPTVGRARIGVGLVTLTTLWFLFKEAFVRHDGHDLVFFVAAPLVLAAFAPKWRSRAWPVTGMLALTFVAVSVSGTVPALVTQPVQSARNFFDEATTLASAHKRAQVVAESRASLNAHFALPPRMVDLMRGQTVDVSPWQETAIWADPLLHFDPLPVLQDYSAYTPSLDQLDTTYLRSPGAPRYILRQPLSEIDGRNPAFDPPATQLAIECRYHEVAANSVWQLLERQSNRCGPVRPLRTAITGPGHWVNVPTAPAGDAVVATFEISNDLWSRFESVLFKPPNVFLAANDGQETWRFVTATGPDLHVLQASSTLGFSSAFVPVQIHNIRFSINGESPGASGITISFYEMSMAPTAGTTAK